MSSFTLSASRRLAVPAPVAYGLIADYTDGHQRIVPPHAIRNLAVVRGGVGAGTEITFDHVVFGRPRKMRATVTEPEPGRVLAERDAASGIETRFIVEPAPDGCTVTIATEIPLHAWPIALLEKAIVRRLLLPLYVEELARLEAEGVKEMRRAA